MNKKLTIIVPVYNAEKFIERAVLSLVNQDYKNIEVLLINDGSTDESLDKCKMLAKKDNRIKIIDKPNSGVSSTRNYGLKVASGDYVTFIDSDDYIETAAYSRCMKILENEEIDFLKFSYYKESKNNKLKYNFVMESNKIISVEDKKNYLEEIFNSKDFEGIWNLVVSKKFIDLNNIKFDETLIVAEDFKFMVNCLLFAKKIFILNEPFYHYVINYDSVTQKYDLGKIIKRCENIIRSYYESSLLLNIAIDSNTFCIKKIMKQLYGKISIIAENEKYSIFKKSVNEINNLDIFKNLREKGNINNIPTSYFFYQKSRLNIKVKNIIKKVVYR